MRHPVRTLLTIFGVSLGVAVTLSVQLIGDEILSSHRRSLEQIAGKAELTILAGEGGMSRSLGDRVAEMGGVAHVEPLLERRLLEPGRGPILLLGIDFLGDDSLRSIEAAEGDEEIIEEPIAFLNSTESVLVPESFARNRGLHRGDQFELVTPVGKRSFRIRGLLQDKGVVRSFGGDVVVMFLDAAQVALGLDEMITRLDVASTDELSAGQLRENLQQALGTNFEVEFPLVRGARLEQMMEGMNQALLLLAALAIWVGMLLAYNAVEISVRQRQREIAILRAVGADQKTIMFQVLMEAMVLGFLSTLLGITLGIFTASGGLSSTAETVSTVYEVVKVGHLQVQWWDLLPALLIGLLIPVIAAIRPARWVAARPPHLGLSRPGSDRVDIQAETRALMVGGAVSVAGLACFLTPGAEQQVWLGQLGFGLVMFGALFLAPAALSALVRLIPRFLGPWLSAETIIATDHVVRDRRRAALNIASLVAGVATVVTIATYITSIKETYDGWLDSTIPADLFVTAGSSFGVSRNLPLDPSVAQLMSELPEVDEMLMVRLFDVDHIDRPIKLLSLPMRKYLGHSDPIVLFGQLPAPSEFDVERQCLVSENLSRRGGYLPGSNLVLDTPSGPQEFEVAAVIMDFTSDQGLIVMDRERFISLYRDDRVDTIDLFLRPDASALDVQEKIRRLWGEEFDLFVLTSKEFKAEALELIDQFFELFRLLQFVTLVIAVLGITTTLIASVLDRTQEVGLMRAVGSTPGQIVRIVITEAGLIGGLSSVLGAALGCVTGVLFLETVVLATAGWFLPYRFPADALLLTTLMVTIASAFAGIYPAWWCARQPTLEAMREE